MENAESLEKVGANVEEVEAELKALALKLGPLKEKPLNLAERRRESRDCCAARKEKERKTEEQLREEKLKLMQERRQ